MTLVTGSVGPQPGCVVTEPVSSAQTDPSGPRLIVIQGRAYRRVELSSRHPRRWRLEALELEEAIDWIIQDQQNPAG